jgi:hypothetical protein
LKRLSKSKENLMNGRTLTLAVFTALAVALSPAAAVTHLVQPVAANHVTLVDGPSGPNPCGTLSFQNRSFFRVLPNATMSTLPFVVPQGRNLVVTDVEWSAYGGPLGTVPLAVGTTLRLKIFLVAGASSGQVFSSRGITLDANSAAGRPGSSEQLTAGFVVGPGVSICPYVYQETPSFGASVYIDGIILRGYLTP